MQLALFLAALQGVTAGVSREAPPDAVRVNVEVRVPRGDSLLPVPDSVALATAYRDSTARELVRLARGHRGVIDAAVFAYTATARQRLSVGLSALRRERLLYQREVASVVHWRRDGPSKVEVRGGREAVPVAMPGVRIPDDLADWGREFVPQPGDDRLFVSPEGGGFAWHPLVENGESVYRYATGDSTVIQLPDGRRIRLIELRVTARRRDIRLITGSFWIERENHAIVQAVFRPAGDFDLERDLPEIDPSEADEVDEVPDIFKPVRFDARYITVEYGLWEMRWWMPRLMAFQGYAQAGPARFPVSIEIAYSDYEVEADRWGLPEFPPLIRQLAGDPYARPRPYTYDIDVVLADSAALLSSPLLAPSFYSAGEELMSEREIRELGKRLGALPPRPWAVGRPRVSWPWTLGPGLTRYNRVEGLSAGARVDWDFSRLRLDLTGRLGTADLTPRAELGVEVPGLNRTWRVAGYHRLAVMDPAIRPFSLGSSLSALMLGRDYGLYFGASGAEVIAGAAPGEPPYRVRLYAEAQRPVRQHTNFSLPHLLDPDRRFGRNPAADRASQLGLAVTAGSEHGLDPAGFRWGAWVDLTAEAGTFTFARPGLTLRASSGLPGRLVGALELAGGTTVSTADERSDLAPFQARWFLGGAPTVRGFDGGSASGPHYARGRAELATEFPAARLALFTDAGWAGTAYHPDDLLLSAGIGASFLDGLVRLDLARAIQPVRQWRLILHADAVF